jgi:hypothetical protein
MVKAVMQSCILSQLHANAWTNNDARFCCNTAYSTLHLINGTDEARISQFTASWSKWWGCFGD